MNMSERGRLGGIASHGTTMAQHRRDVEECRAYLAARRAAGNKTTTLQKTFSGLSVFYTFLEDAELYSGSAMRDIRNIKKTYLSPYKSDAETRQLISIEQAAEMIRRTIKTRDRAILAVLFTTGVRAGELVAIDVGDVDLQGLAITLKPKGKRTNRTVFFSEEARQELQRWLRVRDGVGALDSALFLGEQRVRLQVAGLGDVVKAAASRVGLHDPAGPLEKRFTPHCCRHWWNTYLFLAGLEERYRGYLRGDVPDGSQGQYIHMDALQKEIKKRYLECIPRLGI